MRELNTAKSSPVVENTRFKPLCSIFCVYKTRWGPCLYHLKMSPASSPQPATRPQPSSPTDSRAVPALRPRRRCLRPSSRLCEATGSFQLAQHRGRPPPAAAPQKGGGMLTRSAEREVLTSPVPEKPWDGSPGARGSHVPR